MVKKYYADLPYGQTHYRRAGNGSPVILLHASPLSSQVMLPVLEKLAEHSDAIALDTAGYGQSDSLTQEALQSSDDLSPYVEWLKDTLDALELSKVCLYGSATGAQIAIEFARAYPERVLGLVLDNAADFSEQECQDALENYFPSIAPRADGSHLADVWNIASSLFQWFPWYEQDEEHKVSDQEPPAAVVHATAMAYLQAGDDYAQAYRRAFVNEKAERILGVTVPTKIIRSPDSIVKRYVDRFDNYDWPEHIQMCFCDAGVANRYQVVSEAVAQVIKVANANKV